MAAFERCLNDRPEPTPALLKAALAHAARGHSPVRDGNGRLGRMLIALPLRRRGALREPMLRLSLCLIAVVAVAMAATYAVRATLL